MENYSLEVSNFGTWKLIRDFPNLRGATTFGREAYSQNSWRVVNRTTGSNVYEYDGIGEIEAVALGERARFEDTDTWRQRFADQRVLDAHRAEELRSRPQRGYLAGIARDQRRRFQTAPRAPAGRFYNFEYEPESHEKVNWLKEGF